MVLTDSSGGFLHVAQFHDEGVKLGLWPLGKSESEAEIVYELFIDTYLLWIAPKNGFEGVAVHLPGGASLLHHAVIVIQHNLKHKFFF